MEFNDIKSFCDSLTNEIEKIIIGKKEQIELIIMAILSDGHILLEDMPGSGKTTLVKSLSKAVDAEFKRVQFTPDLLPSDILGMNIYNQKNEEFVFVEGPIKTNILLADEINRAIPRTQSALLEAMEERQITVDGKTMALPKPFIVMATQNPVETQSTFALPAAQMDRFFIKISMGYPSKDEEITMLSNLGDRMPFEKIQKVADPEKINSAKEEIKNVFVSEEIKQYIVDIVQATRNHNLIKSGASPRASRSLYKGAKAYAAMNGRNYVIPEDIQKIALAVLNHRITLGSEAKITGKTAEGVIEEILNTTPVIPVKESIADGGK